MMNSKRTAVGLLYVEVARTPDGKLMGQDALDSAWDKVRALMPEGVITLPSAESAWTDSKGKDHVDKVMVYRVSASHGIELSRKCESIVKAYGQHDGLLQFGTALIPITV